MGKGILDRLVKEGLVSLVDKMIQDMKSAIALLGLFFLSSCNFNNNEENDSFTDNFLELKEFPSSEFYTRNNVLKKNDTVPFHLLSSKLLMPVNDIAYSDKLLGNQYYYYGKYTVNDACYVLAVIRFFDYHESDVTLYTYDVEHDKIVSSLKIISNDFNVKRRSHYKEGVIYIENNLKFPNGLDPEPGKEYLEKVIDEKYVINEQLVFERIK